MNHLTADGLILLNKLPRYDQDFYRPATDEEKTFFLDKMKEFGYELREMYGDIVPQLTVEGYKKFYPNRD